ncbi:FKBP-type 22 kDa peptidyl-prolyl cis-trans isomerase [Novipirellula artificiosorum]|uniref:Peptidyl-prolyl cis-trans isomerase n=2 Tax=Novipirellula artificiosorum TaxID=2528016 RepID=A0A5C6DBD8_9BACT|nr:FKBP-type 22 kDa peptidyl-prolyl cis-trans isomerase [Novipirellula artificiosorum]
MTQRIPSLFSGLALVTLFSTTGSLMAQETAARTYNTVSEEMGYFLGVSIGQQMGSQGFQAEDLDLKALVAGVTDGLNDTEPAMTDEQLKGVQGKIEALLRKRQEEMLLRNKEKGKLWLEQNAKKEGVKQLGEGLQYSVIKAGDGASPTASDTVKVHYTGKLLDGSVFDSSVQRGTPAEFRVGQVIKGWTMALQKMKVGDKWMLYIPSELAYGERGSQGAIGPNEVLIFEVELLGIE